MAVIQFTPKQQEAMNALQSERYNFILYGGAIRGGKTFWGLLSLLILCEIFKGSRWCVIRSDSERIRTTTIPSFVKIEKRGTLKQSPYEYTHWNGSTILFKGENYAKDKELDWMKGLEVNGFLFEEINECQEKTLNKAFERAGSWNLPNLKNPPKPIVLATCNPSNGWVKDRVYTPWMKGTLPETYCYIPAKITDNPHLSKEYIDSLHNMPKYEYMVFVEGDWDVQIKTGGEFWKSFELDKHVKPVTIEPDISFHVTVDDNVRPYIAVSIWQIVKTKQNYTYIRQVHEIPCKDPFNTASKAGQKVCRWLSDRGNEAKVFIYGDSNTTQGNTIDDDKKTFLDKFTEAIESEHRIQKRMFSSNPGVEVSGAFVDAIYEGVIKNVGIEIGDTNKVSISDYIEVKQDADGTMLKTKVTDPHTKVRYEPNGHFSDVKRYFICKALESEFNSFKGRRNGAPFIVGRRKSYVRTT